MKAKWFTRYTGGEYPAPDAEETLSCKVEGKREIKIATFRNPYVGRICLDALQELEINRPEQFIKFLFPKAKGKK